MPLLVLCSEGLFQFFAPRLQYSKVKQGGFSVCAEQRFLYPLGWVAMGVQEELDLLLTRTNRKIPIKL